MNDQKKCKYCKNNLEETWFFCPVCGKEAMQKPPDTSIAKQILIYFVSFFLAPFGLVWTIRYMKSGDKKAVVVGLISLILTILAIVMVVASVWAVMDYYSKMLDGLPRGTTPDSYEMFGQ